MNRHRAIAAAVVLAALCPRMAAAEEAAPGDTILHIADVSSRVDALDPRLREKAFERVRAEVDVRRAEWNRVIGSVGLSATESYTLYNVAPVGPDAASPSVGVHSTGGALTASVRVPIYAGGAISSSIDAAEARLVAARHDREFVRQELKAAAFTAYAQLLAASDQTAIALRAAERAARLVTVATARVESGIAAQADLAQARLNQLRQLEDVEVRRGERELAVAVLRAALLLPRKGVASTDTLEGVAMLGASDTAERADVQLARANVRATAADREVAASAYLPHLDLFASGQYGNVFASSGNSTDPTLTATPGGSPTTSAPALATDGSSWTFRGYVTAGAQVTWNLWDVGVTRDKVARVDADLSRARAALEDRERQAVREQDEARAREDQAQRRVDVLRGGERIAAQAVELARARYETGTAILTEVLNAELEATGIESRQAQARYDRAVAHVERLRAEGRIQ